MTPAKPLTRAAGFTIIELMVVIVIISSLMVFLLPDMLSGGEAAAATETEARILSLKTMIQNYANKTGDFPPSEFSRLSKGVKYRAQTSNEGIECLVLALHQKARRISLADKLGWLGNTDGDESGAPLRGLNDTTKQHEVLDGWGNPLVYFHNRSYSKTQEVVLGGEADGEGLSVNCKAKKSGSRFLNATKYQLISAGSDGEFGTPDDISYPRVVEEEQ